MLSEVVTHVCTVQSWPRTWDKLYNHDLWHVLWLKAIAAQANGSISLTGPSFTEAHQRLCANLETEVHDALHSMMALASQSPGKRAGAFTMAAHGSGSYSLERPPGALRNLL